MELKLKRQVFPRHSEEGYSFLYNSVVSSLRNNLQFARQHLDVAKDVYLSGYDKEIIEQVFKDDFYNCLHDVLYDFEWEDGCYVEEIKSALERIRVRLGYHYECDNWDKEYKPWLDMSNFSVLFRRLLNREFKWIVNSRTITITVLPVEKKRQKRWIHSEERIVTIESAEFQFEIRKDKIDKLISDFTMFLYHPIQTMVR